jgi:DNA invertase Pin-like site-specific DNA recombinase
VKTYADLGKSGVVAKNRTGLRELLKDVVSGEAQYKAVLVYDVSRWGRFPNNDEAAHYEYLCASSGIPLHYCAEHFVNDGTASNSLLKALKRSMAAEFSRELGEKVFRGKTRLVQMGFWVGGRPGYGFRRLMLSGHGKRKQVMKPGEQKSLTTDRVVLIPGPRKEVEVVRQIFTLAALGNGPSAIARSLNEQGMTRYGKSWIHATVRDMVTNPKYMVATPGTDARSACTVQYQVWTRSSGCENLIPFLHWLMRNSSTTPMQACLSGRYGQRKRLLGD